MYGRSRFRGLLVVDDREVLRCMYHVVTKVLFALYVFVSSTYYTRYQLRYKPLVDTQQKRARSMPLRKTKIKTQQTITRTPQDRN